MSGVTLSVSDVLMGCDVAPAGSSASRYSAIGV